MKERHKLYNHRFHRTGHVNYMPSGRNVPAFLALWLWRGGEPVTSAVNRCEIPWTGGIVFNLFAQAGHVLVQGPGGALVAHAPYLVHQGDPVQGLPFTRGEEAQEGQLAPADVEPALPLGPPHRAGIDHHVAESNRTVVLLARFRLAAAQNGSDTGKKLPGTEWLHHVVVCSELEPHDLVHLLSLGG